MKKNLLMAFMLMLAGNSFAQTATDTLVVTTQPQMHCQNCEKKIKSNIRFVKGTKRIDTSVDDQKVTIVYDGRKAKYDDYVEAFKKIGYEIKKK
ncbi:MAG: copper chaperone [Prevotella stercorea]|nr:copper chaperone [Leyella stercorea]MBD8938552.1 copper chaperone [Leyella stercorea]